MKASLLDTKNKVIGASCELPLLVADPPAASPSTYFVDEYGRTIVNGKPKLMIGVFSSYENESLTEIEKDLKKSAPPDSTGLTIFSSSGVIVPMPIIWRILEPVAEIRTCGCRGITGWRAGNRTMTPLLQNYVILWNCSGIIRRCIRGIFRMNPRRLPCRG
ncbi:MAG: hypothetical protein V8T87_06920 [Victivallales bacterium]